MNNVHVPHFHTLHSTCLLAIFSSYTHSISIFVLLVDFYQSINIYNLFRIDHFYRVIVIRLSKKVSIRLIMLAESRARFAIFSTSCSLCARSWWINRLWEMNHLDKELARQNENVGARVTHTLELISFKRRTQAEYNHHVSSTCSHIIFNKTKTIHASVLATHIRARHAATINFLVNDFYYWLMITRRKKVAEKRNIFFFYS